MSTATSITGRQKKNKVFVVTKKFETLLPKLNEETPLDAFEEYGITILLQPSKEEFDESITLLQSLISKTHEPYLKTQFLCSCGSTISNSAKTKHFKSSKHVGYVTAAQLEATLEEYKTKYNTLKMRFNQAIEDEDEDEDEIEDGKESEEGDEVVKFASSMIKEETQI